MASDVNVHVHIRVRVSVSVCMIVHVRVRAHVHVHVFILLCFFQQTTNMDTTPPWGQDKDMDMDNLNRYYAKS